MVSSRWAAAPSDTDGVGSSLRTGLDAVVLINARCVLTGRYNIFIGLANTALICGLLLLSGLTINADRIRSDFRPCFGAVVCIATGAIRSGIDHFGVRFSLAPSPDVIVRSVGVPPIQTVTMRVLVPVSIQSSV